MSIDWTKAPEGATHYQPESRDFHAAWFRLQGGKAREMWVVIPGGALEHIIDPTAFDESMQNLIARPAEPATWNGKGLPPVGTVCEWHGPNSDGPDGWVYTESKVVAYTDDGLFICMQKPSFWPVVQRIDDCEFRPIRTPEQIAAEEREKAALEMAALMSGHDDRSKDCFKVLGEILYDAGYRRQEEGK